MQRIKRRTFLQSFAALVDFPFVAPALRAAVPRDLLYTDSEGTADLSALYDGNTHSGGISYNP